LPANVLVPSERPHLVVSGLPLTGDHPMHPFIIDAEGHLFVDLPGQPSINPKQTQKTGATSPGRRRTAAISAELRGRRHLFRLKRGVCQS
jgi:hypothetical protein